MKGQSRLIQDGEPTTATADMRAFITNGARHSSPDLTVSGRGFLTGPEDGSD